MLAGLLFVSCNKHYTAHQLPATLVTFGDGGGFTGAVTEYTLLENGQLFRSDSMKKDTTEIGKLTKKQAKQLLQEVKALQLDKMTIQEPGNMYYFMGLKEEDQFHKITWGSPNYTIDAKIEALHKKLMSTVKKADKPDM